MLGSIKLFKTLRIIMHPAFLRLKKTPHFNRSISFEKLFYWVTLSTRNTLQLFDWQPFCYYMYYSFPTLLSFQNVEKHFYPTSTQNIIIGLVGVWYWYLNSLQIYSVSSAFRTPVCKEVKKERDSKFNYEMLLITF